MLWKQIFPLGTLVLLIIVGLDRWRMLLVICRTALYTVYRSDLLQYRKLNIYNLHIWLEIQASGSLERGTWSRSLLLFKKVCGLSQLVCFAWETGFWCTCTICLAGVFEDGSEQKCHEERSSVQDLRTWVEVWSWFIWQESGQECTCLQFVWKRGLYSRWEARHLFMYRYRTLRHQFIHLFDNISEGDIKGIVFQHKSLQIY